MTKNIILFLASLFLVMAFGEWLFPNFIEKLPLRLYGLVDKNLRVLAQSSKKTQFPKEYIAITGDSYAVGAGDWLTEMQRSSFWGSPNYSPAHLIYKKTGIDIISFGRSGAGSFDGVWEEPVSQFLYINSFKNYNLSPPKYLLIFFYEGNDIYDNIQFLNENLRPTKKEITKGRYEVNKYQDFLNTRFEKVLSRKFDSSFWKNMLFARSLLQGISNLIEEWTLSNKQPKTTDFYPKAMDEGKVAATLIDGREIQLNVALINEVEIGLPMYMQAPPLLGRSNFEKKIGLTDKSLIYAIDIFKQSLLKLNKFFLQSEIKVVYIPSPLSSYKIVSPNVHYRGFMQSVGIVETNLMKERHRRLCQTIRQIAIKHNFSFLNTTKNIKLASSVEFMHGPLDWDHFNKRGYQVLADTISEIFLKKNEGNRLDNCRY